MKTSGISRKAVYAAVAFTVAAFLAGYAVAATTVSNSSTQSNGNYVSDSSISWWTTATPPSSVTFVPTTVPTSVSTTAGTPSVLPATASNYEVGSGVAGDIAQTLKITEGTGATASTEVEIVFVISTGAATTTTVGYIETQSTIPGTAQTFVFYLDAGSAASASVTINYVAQISQQCSAVGTCP